jgi:hypothetical protein
MFHKNKYVHFSYYLYCLSEYKQYSKLSLILNIGIHPDYSVIQVNEARESHKGHKQLESK